MTILGIDPGSHRAGWACVARQGRRLVCLGAGVLLGGKGPLPDRLAAITRALDPILEAHRPQAASFESAFHGKNARTALVLGHARGALMASVARADCAVFEYAPAQIKTLVAGSGRAGKEQVAAMVYRILGLREALPEDATDALAAAVTHAELHDTPTSAFLREMQSR